MTMQITKLSDCQSGFFVQTAPLFVQERDFVQGPRHRENPYIKLGEVRRDRERGKESAMGSKSARAGLSRRVLSRPVSLGGAGFGGWDGFFVGLICWGMEIVRVKSRFFRDCR